MISVEEAKQLLFERVEKSVPVETDITEAFGLILAEDILSPSDLPLFNQSSMDGYAFAADDLSAQKQFEVVGEIKAGDNASFVLQCGQAIRIFTGAAVPASADAVVMQEKTEQKNGSVYLTSDVKKGTNIRVKGSQIKKDELALKKGSLINPASAGLLASLGISKVKVYKRPAVSILVTGDEIIFPGNKLCPGQIYESNSFMLQAALVQMHINTKNSFNSRDDKDEIKKRVESFLQDSNIILITGGISVGKYDLVLDVLKELGIETIFYKVSQKPGKPFFTGKIDNKWIFALPGNPASALVCFYEYVYPVIRMMQGIENAMLTSLKLKLLKDVKTFDDRSLFIRAKKTKKGVMPLEGQDSGMLLSFAEADVLIYIPKEKQQVKAGEIVDVHLLPFGN